MRETNYNVKWKSQIKKSLLSLITGDSMISGNDEKRLSKKYPVKVCPFPGAWADDMHHYLQKYPDTIILHVSTNNCVNECSRVVLDKILNLKTVINRTDDGSASLTVENLNNHLNPLKFDIADNSTIGKECLGKKGFHRTKSGTGKLAINFINKIKSLWRLTDSFHALHLTSSVTVSSNDEGTSVSQNFTF